MLGFFGGVIKGIGIAIGTAFIAVGTFFGAHAQPAPSPAGSTDSSSISAQASTSVETQAQAPKQKSTGVQVFSSKPSTKSPTDAVLQIGIPTDDVTIDYVTVHWTTNVPSESQLILDSGKGKGFQSETGISVEHEVTIGHPAESQEYGYEIIATTPDKKMTDTYYGSFTAYQRFTAELGTKVDDCTPIFIVNTAGKPIPDMQVEVAEFAKGNAQLGAASYESNYRGVITPKHCEKAERYVVTGVGLEPTTLYVL